MPKARLSNLILSRLDIEKLKLVLGNTPILSTLFKIGSQGLIDYKYPTHIFIETTRACNLKCESCPRDMGVSKSGHMDFTLFTKIIDEATEFGNRNFCLHMLGEPLLSPKITEMVKYIKKANPRHAILLTTNGYLLDNFKSEEFLRCNLDKITFSFFSLKRDKCKALTGSPDISGVINNIKNISMLRKAMRSKTRIYIRLLLTEDNKNELDDFRRLSKDIGVGLEMRPTHNYSGVIKNNYTSSDKHIKIRYPCYHLWFSPAITWDGKVVICCSDWNYAEVLGDIRQESLSNIWQGKRIRELRRLHLAGRYRQIPVCKDCNVWTLYPDIFFSFQEGKTPVC